MRLDELNWCATNHREFPWVADLTTTQIPGRPVKIWKNHDGTNYWITTTPRSWKNIDVLTAQAVLYELLK